MNKDSSSSSFFLLGRGETQITFETRESWPDLISYGPQVWWEMKHIKRILTFMLPLLLLSFAIMNLCAMIESFAGATDQSSYTRAPDRSDDQHSGCKTKSKPPCSNNHSCCNLIVGDVRPLFFDLDSHSLDPGEIILQSSEIPAFLYRPPRTRL